MDERAIEVPTHHPAVVAQEPITASCAPDYDLDFLGIKTRRSFYAGMPGVDSRGAGDRLVTTSHPAFDEEYFEWTDIFESIEQSRSTYVFVELGAGWGRWSMRAAGALRRIKPDCRFQCVAVEAE